VPQPGFADIGLSILLSRQVTAYRLKLRGARDKRNIQARFQPISDAIAGIDLDGGDMGLDIVEIQLTEKDGIQGQETTQGQAVTILITIGNTGLYGDTVSEQGMLFAENIPNARAGLRFPGFLLCCSYGLSIGASCSRTQTKHGRTDS